MILAIVKRIVVYAFPQWFAVPPIVRVLFLLPSMEAQPIVQTSLEGEGSAGFMISSASEISNAAKCISRVLSLRFAKSLRARAKYPRIRRT